VEELGLHTHGKKAAEQYVVHRRTESLRIIFGNADCKMSCDARFIGREADAIYAGLSVSESSMYDLRITHTFYASHPPQVINVLSNTQYVVERSGPSNDGLDMY